LELEVKPRRILIKVKDTGIGIPALDLPYIFDRFYRVDKARTRQTGGFGLGLAIAQQIIQAHDGRITVESEAKKGTTFQICLSVRS
jgi:signal transduction histidine kinase